MPVLPNYLARTFYSLCFVLIYTCTRHRRGWGDPGIQEEMSQVPEYKVRVLFTRPSRMALQIFFVYTETFLSIEHPKGVPLENAHLKDDVRKLVVM